ncbi:ATP-binding cassette domain-containing protein [Desulfocurvibacter africanus]|uniref:ABC transporter ATP-binding protein n=1 Tax=Desulfocurvibacter africanus TaxID=873 RepID=UPI002FD9D979
MEGTVSSRHAPVGSSDGPIGGPSVAGQAPLEVPPHGAPAISLRNVGFCYSVRRGIFGRSRKWALRDISFELFHGETLGIMGRNGVGKSTLLRLLAGLTEPDRGELINHGCSCSLLALQAGFVLYLTGRENVFLSGMTLGLSKAQMRDRLEDIRAFADLGEAFDQPVRTYSTGMLARLGFSIAFQVSPDVLLIDEVLGVGDENFREKSATALRDKIGQDKTAVVVSHSPASILELCDRAVLVDQGVSVFVGGTRECIKEYQQLLNKAAKGR